MRILSALVALALLCGCATPPRASSGPAQRIISLVPSLTEVLFSLGAGPRVVGVTANDHYPPEVEALPRVGDMAPDYERILALRPDLVVADPGMQPREITRLRELGLPVLSLPSQSLMGLQNALVELGKATGTEARGQELQSQLASLKPPVGPRVRVFVEIWDKPLITTGGGTFVDELINLAGGLNVYADHQRYPSISVEDLLLRQPEVIVLTVSQVEEARSRPGWDRLEAVRSGRLYRMESDLLVRPTLRLPQAVEQLEGFLKP